MTELAEQIASELRAASETRRAIPPIRERIEPGNIDIAYVIQDANTRHAIGSGKRLVGRKIGLTSLAVQKQLGVDQPDFGMLFADMEVGEGLPIAIGRLIQPKIEAEIAFVLDRDLNQEQPTLVDVIRATAFIAPALEIVDSRIRDWSIQIVDTVADNASSGLYVIGGPVRKLDGLDLRAMRMTLHRGGDLLSEGSGLACLGHPLNAVRWLAEEMLRRGRPLVAGDTILSGALGPMVPVHPGDVFGARIEGLGEVSAHFAECPIEVCQAEHSRSQKNDSDGDLI